MLGSNLNVDCVCIFGGVHPARITWKGSGQITTTLFPGIDNTAFLAVVNALMERIRANERHAMMVLRHDVEHRCIVELLKILEDAQSPDYMLHKVLMFPRHAAINKLTHVNKTITSLYAPSETSK
jgi:hypothetical protein